MSDGIVSIVGSYDFFGKSIPGAVLLLGLGSFLPQSVLSQTRQALEQPANGSLFALNTMVDLIALGLIIIIIGVIIGQGVHTSAILMENIAYWFGNRVAGVWNTLIDLKGSYSPYFINVLIKGIRRWIFRAIDSTKIWVGQRRISRSVVSSRPYKSTTRIAHNAKEWIFNIKRGGANVLEELASKGVLFELIRLSNVVQRNWRSGIRVWYRRRYWGINDTFKSHRRLFLEEISWYLSPYVERRNSGNYQLSKERFIEAACDRYDIRRSEFAEKDQLYTLVISDLASSKLNRAERMQARYSFCRGMWVVLLITVFFYILVLAGRTQPLSEYGLYFIQYINVFHEQPLIVSLLSGQSFNSVLRGAILVLVIGIIVFMAGSSQYKKHYIEYIYSELYILHEHQ